MDINSNLKNQEGLNYINEIKLADGIYFSDYRKNSNH